MRLMTSCEQGCGRFATVYAIDPITGGWGGWYCDTCAKLLDFRITQRIRPAPVSVPAPRPLEDT